VKQHCDWFVAHWLATDAVQFSSSNTDFLLGSAGPNDSTSRSPARGAKGGRGRVPTSHIDFPLEAGKGIPGPRLATWSPVRLSPKKSSVQAAGN
jgi:hypothetical protein